MKFHAVLTILNLFFIIFTRAGADTGNCPVNEKFNSCGSACQRNCQNRHIKIQCIDKCVSGCFCKEGYIRTFENGPCIPEAKCEKVPTCKENEQLAKCSDTCPRTCQNNGLRRDGCSETVYCVKAPCPQPECLAECVCKPGYVREKLGGDCIPEDTCKNRCEKNREYRRCGTACPGTCTAPSRPCILLCVPGCICKEGYLLDDRTNECVKAEECHRLPGNSTTT